MHEEPCVNLKMYLNYALDYWQQQSKMALKSKIEALHE